MFVDIDLVEKTLAQVVDRHDPFDIAKDGNEAFCSHL